MLRDEVPRTAVLLYLFADPAEAGTRGELAALAEAADRLAGLPLTVLGISPAKLDALKEAQRELKLPYPLLHDDRGFSVHYGVEAPEGESAPPALVAVDRQQRIRWIANPAGSVKEAVGQLESDLAKLPSSTSNYPRTVINRLVDRWIN
jgi:peroxiredoxin